MFCNIFANTPVREYSVVDGPEMYPVNLKQSVKKKVKVVGFYSLTIASTMTSIISPTVSAYSLFTCLPAETSSRDC